MDLEIVILTEANYREGEIVYDIPYMWHPLLYDTPYMIQMNLLRKQKETHRLIEWNYGCQGEGIDWEGHVHTAIFKTDNQQGPTG